MARKDKQATWRKKDFGGEVKRMTRSTFRKSLSMIKEKHQDGEFFETVLLPDHPHGYVPDPVSDRDEIAEWLAENVLDFYIEINSIYQGLLEVPGWQFPDQAQYLWKSAKADEAKEVEVGEYVDNVFVWLDSMSEDPAVFPVEEEDPFPADFRENYMKVSFKRLFRVFAIVYSNKELKKPEHKDAMKHLNTCFTHFVYFIIYWDLVDVAKEAKVIEKPFQKVYRKYNVDAEAYANDI
mmetsp:Transcript_11685/g.13437  ORF Transcript_11685/g.13437 Transcript_11685/m.13437 type:complete len:237 (+) Transcript_11685:432-1142(+)